MAVFAAPNAIEIMLVSYWEAPKNNQAPYHWPPSRFKGLTAKSGASFAATAASSSLVEQGSIIGGKLSDFGCLIKACLTIISVGDMISSRLMWQIE